LIPARKPQEETALTVLPGPLSAYRPLLASLLLLTAGLTAACGPSASPDHLVSASSARAAKPAESKNEAPRSDPAPAAAEKTRVNQATLSDSDSDGIPDGAELRSFDDRSNFRRWFAGIAELQFYSISGEWNQEQQDCAGLVRFSIREALRTHDRPWFQRVGARYESIAPDVRAYRLTDGVLGERLFRTDYGSFKQDDLTGAKFSEFADARTLKNYNSVFISRNRREAQPGDLLFFHEPRNPRYPYHVMIFIGGARHGDEGANDWVVYHTGSSAADNGTVKKVRLAVLDGHPDRRWRPVEGNTNFLGFYRLKILD
jgi:uncharacterized protein YfaT (DUF1175 family)